MRLIGLAGVARSGKDTFYEISKNILFKKNYVASRFAFADELKSEINSVLKSNSFTLDPYTKDTKEKNILRPLMVWWGCTRRSMGDGKYWIDKIDSKVKEKLKVKNSVTFITDVRFSNEVDWIHNLGGAVIHIQKFFYMNHQKQYTPPANEEEEKNDPFVRSLSDWKFEWEDQAQDIEKCIENTKLNTLVNKFFFGKK